MKRKINTLLWIVTTVLLLFVVFLIWENHSYQRQIEERDIFINHLLLKDSISSRFIKIEDQDSMFIYSYDIADDGHVLTYDELSKEYHFYRREAEIKDVILVRAKQHYKFNYSAKINGDTIILGFWEKSK